MRGSRVKKTVIVLVVIVGVLVAADFGVAAAAEYQVSKKMRTELGLADDPSVDIHGFPFITQAIAGDYQDISINATGVPAKNTLRDLEVDADLHNVRVPLSDLLSGNVQQLSVDEVDGQVEIKASDVGRLLDIPDLSINPVSLDTIYGVGADEKQQEQDQQTGQDPQSAGLQLTGTIDFAGQKTKVTAYGVIQLVGGDIKVTPTKLEVSNSLISGSLPESFESELLPKFAVDLKPSDLPLPFTVQVTGVQVQSGILVVQGKAKNVVLNAGSGGSSQGG
ncbi:MAG TPA: DUF2993 domain-containing protein [Pseudonocardiaceae bacterium]|nr:DUF2993 domain-containing protein [Pseudonocardiaceae bacterium]